ncbi:rhamnogalacturonan lyase family protein [Butyrivibrio sp. NC2007]|uniref:rhamnogalacturonan lyase family protein n=1 Tax=Butyrivibrio sp. NC2007 TaxID=1280683 RepID=UPI0003B67CA6|nr:Ig-like domain-containing protein [Butyrivibrio sp. NC2007]
MGNQKKNGLVRAIAFATSISLTVSSVFAYSTVKSYAAEETAALESSVLDSSEESSDAASDASSEESSAAADGSSESSFDEASAGSGSTNEDAAAEEDGEEETDEETDEETEEEADAANSASTEATDDDLAKEKAKSAVRLLGLAPTPATVEQGDDGYENFVEDTVVADFLFGTDNGISSESVYSEETGYGFSDVDFDTDPVGWSGNVYYPRVANVTEDSASHVTDEDSYLGISSKVWTETESTGYGVYTYENTSTFNVDLYNADYEVEVTLTNPTDSSYSAYLEAEDITQESGITVGGRSSATVSFQTNLVDSQLNLKFLAASSATSISDAGTNNVYVSEAKITRLKTQEAGSKPTLYIASDSTVQTYDAYYYPQTGWGQVFSDWFGEFVEEREADDADFSQAQVYETANVIVENRAIGGRSSSSFIQEGKLEDILEDIKQGDYLFIQWGHNDATYSRPNRYVSSSDFGDYIMQYVDGAYQRGATPVLVTPVARYSYTDNGDGTVTWSSNFEAYRQVMISLANEHDIPLIDLTARSGDICEDFGAEGAKSLFLCGVEAGDYTEGAYTGGSSDATHLQWYGAFKFSQAVAQGILDFANEEDNDYALGFNDQLDSLAELVSIDASTEAPEKVLDLESTSVGSTSVSLSWTQATGAEMYYIYRAELEDGQTVADVDFSNATKYSVSTKTKYTDSGCNSGITYVYAVAAWNSFGTGELSDVIAVSTKEAGLKFDFNYNNSPTMEGWTGVNQNQAYDATTGYGWITAPGNGRYRNGNGNNDSSDMADDFNLGGGEFAVDLPNGSYEVTIYACDLLPGTSTIKVVYNAEGVSFGSIATKQALASCTGTVAVTDGQLNITVGGTNNYINGMTITSLLTAPSNLTITELSFTATTANFLLSFGTVDDAVSYTVYQKSESDAEFSVAKTFTAQELLDSELDCRAMVADLGETYSYYMTCTNSEGTESPASNVVTQSMLDESVAVPSAPINLVCTSPEAGQTELQHYVDLKWDANATEEGVIKYIVYRSQKPESDKAFKGYEKIGETKSPVYTDDTVYTNIHYYYKVAALNAGGLGEMSDVCITPVVGNLVAGGLEHYSSRALVAINLAGGAGAETKVSATDAEGNEITSGVYLSWRAFAGDLDGDGNVTSSFTVYRNGAAIAEDLKVTNCVDEGGSASDTYTVVGSNDASLGISAVSTAVWNNQYQEFQLNRPSDQTMPDGTSASYTANDMSVGDLNGDGDLELIVKWYPSNAKDNSGSGYTGTTFLDAYDIDFATGSATLMWRIDLGINIRSGAHYTQFQVWDYDADGAAEIAVKTADGTTTYDANLNETGFVGACSMAALDTATISTENDYRNSSGYVLDGPEYFSMFNGEDGTIIDTVEYLPGRGSVSAWGDGYGNRVDRFLSGTAYLNGTTPFAVFARGYYTRTCLTAYYLSTADDGTQSIGVYWQFDTLNAGAQYEGQGNHALSVNDVDGDGCDEIIYGSLTVDNDGSVLYSTGLGHGDAEHVGDWIPSRSGLEVMDVHEHDNAAYHVEIHDAETGEVLTGYYTGKDTGRGVASDIDPRYEGAEYWSIANPAYTGSDEPSWDTRTANVFSSLSGIYDSSDASGSSMITVNEGATPPSNFSIYWDGDLLAEMQDHTFDSGAYAPLTTTIEKWDYENGQNVNLFESSEVLTSNGTKGNLGLVADILGDWREEIIARCSADSSRIRVYSTTIQTEYVIPCLLTDLAYREGVAWQNVGYNQPAHTSFLVSNGLITAGLLAGEISSSSVEVQFTPANDGALYGHEITGYEIYRAKADDDGNAGEYELIASKDVAELDQVAKSEDGSGSGSGDAAEVTKPVDYKFDFGAGNTQDGWTAVSAATEYSEELGYGFSDVSSISNKTYAALENEESDLYYDSALAWIANGSCEFVVDVPNGSYEVTQYIYNGSGASYQKLTAEGVEFADFRHGNTDKITYSETQTVEVTDGKLNLVNTVTKNGYAAMYFTGFEVKTANYDEALAKYEAAQSGAQGGSASGSGVSADTVFSYVDETVEGNTNYLYRVAAVVDGKTSYKSLPLSVLTTVSIASIDADQLQALQNQQLVEDTVLAEGQSVADLLRANVGTVKVKDSEGKTQTVSVSYEADEVDIENVGTYTAYANVRGYGSNPVEVTVIVVPNKATGYAQLDAVEVIEGQEAKLPEFVTATFLNGTSKDVAVTWDTASLDTGVVGVYEIAGTVENDAEAEITLTVNVVADYVVAVADSFTELVIGDADAASKLPATVSATYKSGSVKDVPVAWDVAGIDVSTAGTYKTTGTIEGSVIVANLTVTVDYQALYKFDFGIKAGVSADGWTEVVVNPKNGTTKLSDLGSFYTEEKGWGFSDDEQFTQGRSEGFTVDGALDANVYTDFALPAGQEFWVDVKNGTYQVEVLSNSVYKSNVKGAVEGVSYNVSNAAGTYNWAVLTDVEVTDGQLTFTFDSATTSRMGAIIIRQKEVVVPKEDQVITGTTSYNVSLARNNYVLDAVTSGDGALSYASSNEEVVTVAEDGTLNLVSTGNAIITVTAAETDAYNEAVMLINVHVNAYYEVDAEGNKVFYKDGDKLANGFVTEVEGTYYVKKGVAQTGLMTDRLTLYYFSEDADDLGVMQTGFVTVKGKTYYFGENGKAVRGWFNVDGAQYYANLDYTIHDGFLIGLLATYYFDPQTHAMVKGFKTINIRGEELLYHFDEKTGKATTGWFTVDGVQYFAIGGEVQRGIVWILLKVYHFDETTGALIAQRSIFGRW